VNGTSGNVYKEQNVSPPDTATLSIPQPTGTNSISSTAIGGDGSSVIGTASAVSTSTRATSSSPPESTSGAYPTAGGVGGALVAGIMVAVLLL
jgi:hypothetical protein